MINSVLIYDGTFEGLLTCIFQVYEQKLFGCHIQNQSVAVPMLFSQRILVETKPDKAARVWNGLEKKAGKISQRRFISLYLSELPEMGQLFFGYMQYVFTSRMNVEKDYSNNYVLKVSQIERKVLREKHRMEAFV